MFGPWYVNNLNKGLYKGFEFVYMAVCGSNLEYLVNVNLKSGLCSVTGVSPLF